jgi:hypothetical protein
MPVVLHRAFRAVACPAALSAAAAAAAKQARSFSQDPRAALGDVGDAEDLYQIVGCDHRVSKAELKRAFRQVRHCATPGQAVARTVWPSSALIHSFGGPAESQGAAP